MTRVVIQPFGIRRNDLESHTLYEIIREADIKLTSTCGGLGRCGKCRIFAAGKDSNLNNPTALERAHLSSQDLSNGIRLACQARVLRETAIFIPEESMNDHIKSEMEGPRTETKLLPCVRKFYIELPKPTIQDAQPDLERIAELLSEYAIQISSVRPKILRDMPRMLRDADWKVSIAVWNSREILDIERGNKSDSCFGIAIDVGTTRLACYLVNLVTGKTVAMSSLANPQASIGEDIMARLTFAMNGENERNELQLKAIDGINCLIAQCCSKAGIDCHHIYEATVVGNTVMHNLLLGINPSGLAVSPYTPVSKTQLDLVAEETGLSINSSGNVHFLPTISNFLGSDCVADVLATGLFKARNPNLLLDIGTNTEIVLGNQSSMLACSCASGPAFEGAHIKHGMKAASGAIESVKINPETLEVSFQTIGHVPPRGLCGSAVIDVVAEMLRAGIVDKRGAIRPRIATSRVRTNDQGEQEFVVVQRNGENRKELVLTQRDVREIQLAKGAIFTGTSILMQEMDVKPDNISRVFIAGAFGTFINPMNAMAIRMIPSISHNKISNVGNAAGTGARMALVSSKARRICEGISDKVRHVELAAHPDFQSTFIESLNFSS